METRIQYVMCPICNKKILVPPKWWDKYVLITCRTCNTKWREVIPVPEPTITEELFEGAEDFLSSISQDAKDFLFGSRSKKQ